MRHTALRCTFMFALLAWVVPAHANPGEFCADLARRWCMGTVSVNADDSRYRSSVFSNGDFLTEVTEHGQTERMFKRNEEQREAYFGLTQDEQRPGRIGFKFSLEGAGMAMWVLAIAFPDGPASVPAAPVQKQVDVPGAHTAVSAWRLEDGRVAFRLPAPKGEPGKYVSGEFSSVRPPPLPADVVASWGPALHVEPLVRLAPRRP